uniref:Putative kazalzinho kazal type serine protease inhibitor n=1 Tax=Rhodnius prolixus TaxID=13249 RepID=R4G5P1_RHOPR
MNMKLYLLLLGTLMFFGVPSSSNLQPPPRNLCKVFCKEEHSPVCGFNEHDSSFPMFHTFKNLCEMNRENACFNKDWQAIANCSCSTVDSCAC